MVKNTSYEVPHYINFHLPPVTFCLLGPNLFLSTILLNSWLWVQNKNVKTCVFEDIKPQELVNRVNLCSDSFQGPIPKNFLSGEDS